MSSSEPHGLVLEIQRMSTEDGPGLRTTLFLKGCSMRCRWCHNPESIAPGAQVYWTANRCIGCGLCVGVCRQQALSFGGVGGSGGGSVASALRIDRDRCTACGLCLEACPAAALELWGRRMGVAETVRELVKDSAYFGPEGGVTLSGGEACLQADYSSALLRALKAAGLHTALDTCGLCTPENFTAVADLADLVLFDLKEADPCLHHDYTGAPLEPVLRNFRLLTGSNTLKDKKVWVRTPIIPGMTDREENIRGIAALLLEAEERVDRWELCAFNRLCLGKYQQLGVDWELATQPLLTSSRMQALVAAAVAAGWSRSKISATGAVSPDTGKKENNNG